MVNSLFNITGANISGTSISGADNPPAAKPKAPSNTLGPLIARPIVLVGLMGAGKTTVGRRLAAALDLPFIDADAEIETAAGSTVEEIFARHGESAFREGERRVISRLLSDGPMVLATGGGAYIDPGTRAAIKEKGTSIWLRADIDVLMRRVGKRNNRPLLKTDNPRRVMEQLIEKRYPIYAEADIIIDSREGPHDYMVRTIIAALADHAARMNAEA